MKIVDWAVFEVGTHNFWGCGALNEKLLDFVHFGTKLTFSDLSSDFEWSKRGCEATELSFFERSEKKRSSRSEFFFDS